MAQAGYYFFDICALTGVSTALFFVFRSIGAFLIGSKESLLEQCAIGLFCVAWIPPLLGLVGLLNPLNLKIILFFLFLTAFWNYRKAPISLGFIRSSAPSLSRSQWTAIFILIMLFLGRWFRCSIPPIGYDALSFQLPLLRDYAESGWLTPAYQNPCDRRIPLGGVWIKLYFFIWDPHGRAILLMNLGLSILITAGVYHQARKYLKQTQSLYVCLAFAAVTDFSVYAFNVSEEMLLAFFVGAISLQIFEKRQRSFWHDLLRLSIIGFLFSIKMTALFWAPFLILIVLYQVRHESKKLLWGSLFFLFCSTVWHSYTHIHYKTIYPFQNHGNLLYGVLKDVAPIHSETLISEEKSKLNLSNLTSTTDPSIGLKSISRWFEKLDDVLLLPFGPMIWWSLLTIFLFWIYFHNPPPMRTSLMATLALGALCLAISMFAWKSTAQAFFRYNLPTWTILLPVSAIIPFTILYHPLPQKLLKWNIIAFAVLSFGIESRVLTQNLTRAFSLNPNQYSKNFATDHQLITSLHNFMGPEDKAFYIGNSSYLLPNNNFIVAQAGNESGWRSLGELQRLLKEENVNYWAISSLCFQEARTYPIYPATTEYLVKKNMLKLISDTNHGKIYQVTR